MPELTPILTALRERFSLILGSQMTAMYLFGSHARGEARDSADIDVLIVMKENFDYEDLLARTSKSVAALSLENDVVISRAFVSQEQFEHGESPFLCNVRREAVVI